MRLGGRIILLAGASLLAVAPARADTLREALAAAYERNPTLTGARAQLRATDENVPISRAAGLPTLGATGQYDENVIQASSNFNAPLRSGFAGGQLSVPLYLGGQVRNNIRAAERRVDAGAAQLRGTEASVFSQVVAAYNDVIRDQAIVALNRENVNVLQVNLRATNDRFEVGDLTRTDIAQSQSRLALAEADLRSAEAQLISSRERYIQLVGDTPDALEPPPQLGNLPSDPDAAVTVAIENNPDLEAVARELEATGFDVRAARALRGPRLSAVGTVGYTNFLGSLRANAIGVPIDQGQLTAGVGLQGTLPLFQGGLPAARVRQAQARQSATIERGIEIERSVIAQTRAAFASWQASLRAIQSSQVAVDASTLSLEGVRAENSVGNRTIIEILNAQQELLIAQVNLVSARRNAYVAAFTLLAAMGRAEARDLGLDGGTLYDPAVNRARVRNRIWDYDEDETPTAVSTRTVDTPAQNPETVPLPQP
ncbi:outer membrane protein [Sphingomonas jejuensis]|uniref:Outer membrane protein n=1 Tax=Sphingomonas jejuensis TaxID=904715 RepID=A0ABX0XHD7_9SPHN|nr:TolC family outer membrane protein [Sphingomonas jejuensis]NJC32748.1 outer membrane protein [Sphingomonas jejuensis]